MFAHLDGLLHDPTLEQRHRIVALAGEDLDLGAGREGGRVAERKIAGRREPSRYTRRAEEMRLTSLVT